MENAVDALKIAFAIIVFTLAIAIAFSVISNIRHTSDVLFETSDKNKYYIEDLQDITYVVAEAEVNRTVSAETIIPTIYRYNKENFGVTIVVGDEPVARFDLETEGIEWKDDSAIDNHIKNYLNLYVNPNKLSDSTSTDSIWNTSNLKELYKMKNNNIATPWLGNDENILKRINVDIYGGEFQFNSDTKYVRNIGLIDILNSDFKEYFIFVPQLKSDGTKDLDKTDKLEIIYVKE